MRGSGRGWPAYAAIFVLALSLRVGYEALVWNGPLGNADSAAYGDLAASIAHHQPYHTKQSTGPGGFPPDMQRPPGYPAFLAAINFCSATATTISHHRSSLAQCILGAAFSALLAWLVATLTSTWIGLLAGCFYATDWVTIVYTPLVISETVYTVMLGSAVLIYALALSRYRYSLYLAAGALLGGAALVKPAAQVVVAAFLIGWACRRPIRLSGLLFLVTYLACVLPWMMRNEAEYGVFTLSEIGTANLYFYTAEGSRHSYPVQDLAGNQINADVTNLDRAWRAQALTPNERTRQMRHEAMQIIRSHWPTVLRQAMLGFVRTALGTGSVTAADSMNVMPGRAARVLLNVLPLAQACVLWALAILAFFAVGFLRWEYRVLLMATIFCVLLPAAAPSAQSRFRVPAVPEICALAAAGVAVLAANHVDRKYQSRAHVNLSAGFPKT